LGSTKLSALTQQSETSGNALAAVSTSPDSDAIRRTREDQFDLQRHLTLLQQLEEIRISQGHNHGEDDGITNQTTQEEMVAAPSTGFTRRVESILVYNADTATAVIQVSKNNGIARRIFHRESLATVTDTVVATPVLLSSSDSIDIVLEGNVTTNQLMWVVSWRDFDDI